MAQPPMPQEMHAYQSFGGAPQPPSQFRPLNVKDALSYLDQVKLQFSNQPEVYNQFLDIMKEFKSQSIDTPGVIQRVSTLFKGHRNLIQGFNTFLPPGYKIEDDDSVTFQPPQEQIPPQYVTAPPPHQPQVMQIPRSSPPHFPMAHAQPQPYPQMPAPVPPQPAMRKTPVEFDHAINYVNKIKTRFHNQPEIYKSFLDILHVYQKEQKTIKEVYDQVASLFRNHSDLLEEFTHFLPEAGVPHQQQAMQPLPHPLPIPGEQPNHPPPPSAPATAENFTQPVKKTPGASKTTPSAKQQKRAGLDDAAKHQSQHPQAPPSKKMKTSKIQPQAAGILPPAQPAPPLPIYEQEPEPKLKKINIEELEYFDKIKKVLDNKHAYSEFLKCLNLFSQEIISRHDLVQMVSTFLGKIPELFDWFKKFIGYKEPPSDSIPPLEKIPVVDYNQCKRYGPSYRALPKSYPHPKCSGRTDLCSETLNDVWVSFPIWSEDSPFLASKKNIYEEAIFRAEDERYELDRIIELNMTTIRNFEAVHKKIQGMSAEEVQKFRLHNNLGGTSEVIYHQAIKRIYGEKAAEVIEGLKRYPAVAIPVVLIRLNQKTEEWKKAQREWRKVWGEIYSKNLYRSLDHQGIIFRQNDKKNLTQKVLLQEAEQLFQDQKSKEADGVSSQLTSHYQFFLPDPSIFLDVSRLITFCLEKSSGFTSSEKERVSSFVSDFISQFFFVRDRKAPRPDPDQMEVDETPSQRPTSSSSSSSLSSSAAAPTTPASSTPSLEASAPPGVRRSLQEQPQPSELNIFYANGTLFALLRLFQLAYSRLERLKELAEAAKSNRHRFGRVNPTAESLGLHNSHLPEIPPERLYSTALDYLEQFIEGKVDPTKFEDLTREMFGVDSYAVSTYDKLIHSIVKQISALSTEEKAQQLLDAYLKFTPEIGAFKEYKAKAEALIGDEMSFKFSFRKSSAQLAILILPKPSEAQLANAVEERWSRYVEQYVKSDHISPLPSKSPVFLKRNKRQSEDLGSVEIVNNLECKICVNTYRMFFVENSEDFFHRKTKGPSPKAQQALRLEKQKRLHSFLNGPKGWRGQEASPERAEELVLRCLRFLRGNDGISARVEVVGKEEGSALCKYVTLAPPSPSPSSSSSSSSFAAPSSAPSGLTNGRIESQDDMILS